MKCLFCTTELPVDMTTKDITCPKCGSELTAKHLITHSFLGAAMTTVKLEPKELPIYGENERYDSPQNY